MKTFHMAMKYAEKHNKNAPALTKDVFFAEQSDFVDKSGRWGGLLISRGGCRLHRRSGRLRDGLAFPLKRRGRGAGCSGPCRGP